MFSYSYTLLARGIPNPAGHGQPFNLTTLRLCLWDSSGNYLSIPPLTDFSESEISRQISLLLNTKRVRIGNTSKYFSYVHYNFWKYFHVFWEVLIAMHRVTSELQWDWQYFRQKPIFFLNVWQITFENALFPFFICNIPWIINSLNSCGHN